MAEDPILYLPNRVVVQLSGADAESLLQRLITIDLDDLIEGGSPSWRFAHASGQDFFGLLAQSRQGILPL